MMNNNYNNLEARMTAYAERIAAYRSWIAIDWAINEAEKEGFHVNYVESWTHVGRGAIAPHVTVESVTDAVSVTVDLVA